MQLDLYDDDDGVGASQNDLNLANHMLVIFFLKKKKMSLIKSHKVAGLARL